MKTTADGVAVNTTTAPRAPVAVMKCGCGAVLVDTKIPHMQPGGEGIVCELR